MEASNNPSDYQIHDSPNSTNDSPETQRQRSGQERNNSQLSLSNNTNLIQQQTSTNTTNTTNSSQQNEQQQRHRVITCDCGLESVLREVKANTINRGRYFWSCSKFGGPEHLMRCNFFRWDSSSLHQDDGNDVNAESSSIAQNRSNRSDMPYVLIESANINFENNLNDNDDDTTNDDGEIDLYPCPDQLSENEDTRASSITTPPTTPHRRIRNSFGRASSPQASESVPERQDTTTTVATIEADEDTRATRNLTGDVYTRNPAVFGNWDNVPKFSTPQLLDIVQNHLVQQDKNYQKWYVATQSAKKDLEKAKKEVEKLKRDLDVANREIKLNKRESEVLKSEKRLLQHENNVLREENRELKRGRY